MILTRFSMLPKDITLKLDIVVFKYISIEQCIKFKNSIHVGEDKLISSLEEYVVDR